MDRIYLSGSHDVLQAGSAISSAASEMQRAASNIDSTLDIFLRRFEQEVSRFVDAVDKMEAIARMTPTDPPKENQ